MRIAETTESQNRKSDPAFFFLPGPKPVMFKGYVEKLVEKEVNRERTFDEILAPFRDAVERSGVSDEELDTLFTKARRKVGCTMSAKD